MRRIPRSAFVRTSRRQKGDFMRATITEEDDRRRSGTGNQVFETFLGMLRQRRDEIEGLCRLPDDIAVSMKRLGLYRTLVPRSLGGDERSPATFLRLVERISSADGSAGWVASFAGAVVYLSGLAPHRFEQFYADGPDVAFAAGLFPVQPVRQRGNMLTLNGRWKFASGCSGADWLGAGIVIEDEGQLAKPRMIIFPRRKAQLIADWRVVGLAGTGSYDLVLKDIEIEADWSFVRGGGTTRTEPIYHFPVIPFSALNHAIVGVGIALAALEEARAAITGEPRTASFAAATAKLLSTRAFIYRQTEHVWDHVQRAAAVPVKDQGLLRIAAKLAAEAATDACRAALDITDPDDAITRKNLSRHLRDALVVGQHAFLSTATYEQAGQVLLGQPAPPGFV
jgi:alkylation response protein AidB-like acyl-CoA dehydrogenase